MQFIKMVSPITNRVMACDADAQAYLTRAGWVIHQEKAARKVWPVKTGRISTGARCTERAKLFHDAVKAEMDFCRLNEKDATNRILMK